jgi:cell division protein ZapA
MSDLEENGPQQSQPPQESVVVEIYDQQYHLRGTDTEHIIELARFVDAKMRTVAEHSSTADSLRVAVLAALNIADELAQLRETGTVAAATDEAARPPEALRSRADSLHSLLDDVLGDSDKK